MFIEKPKPSLEVDPAESVFIGESVSLKCKIGSGDSWKYVWKKNGQQLHESEEEYKFPNVDQSHQGEYTCEGTQPGRINTPSSNTVTLRVSGIPTPTVKVHPALSVFIEETVTLTCEIGSEYSWSYEWKKGGTVQSQYSKTYQISTVDWNHGDTYSCRGGLSGRITTHTSASVTLTVSEKPTPTVKVQPDLSVFIGETVTLTCEIHSGGSWSYEWYKDRTLQTQQWNSVQTFKADGNHRGAYSCRGLSGRINTHTSAAVTLTVSEKPTPTVKIQPDPSVFIGETVTLTCEIHSGGSWSYEWYKDRTLPSQQRNSVQTFKADGNHRGAYSCRGLSGRITTHTSAAVTLTVSASGD
ncbi:carcinoembryonic antigen-related cell adhesion molecule 5-like [Hoplias malabaricus]|uniref:carcinoembryonic antigen-related cell adhesion molecule 5-like n=1 Tax=Hoplias malabaricus TaxID=27720 RepID=UPI00346224EA